MVCWWVFDLLLVCVSEDSASGLVKFAAAVDQMFQGINYYLLFFLPVTPDYHFTILVIVSWSRYVLGKLLMSVVSRCLTPVMMMDLVEVLHRANVGVRWWCLKWNRHAHDIHAIACTSEARQGRWTVHHSNYNALYLYRVMKRYILYSNPFRYVGMLKNKNIFFIIPNIFPPCREVPWKNGNLMKYW